MENIDGDRKTGGTKEKEKDKNKYFHNKGRKQLIDLPPPLKKKESLRDNEYKQKRKRKKEV